MAVPNIDIGIVEAEITMNGLKKCVLSVVKNFRIVKIFFFVVTVLLLFDELRKELKRKYIFIYMYIHFFLISKNSFRH